MREVWRTPHRAVSCEAVNWHSGTPPKYVVFRDTETNEHFIGTQKLGAWMEEDVLEVAAKLNMLHGNS